MKTMKVYLLMALCLLWAVSARGDAGDPVVENKEIAGSLKFDTGATVDEFSTDGTLAGDSDAAVSTEKAVKAYVDNAGGQVNLLTNSGFGVWSNSEDLYIAVTSGGSTAGDIPCTTNICVGRGLAPNNSASTPSGDTEANATTGWTNEDFNTFESSWDFFQRMLPASRFKNRTVTGGIWLKTDAASQVQLNLYNGGDNFSVINSTNDWEWHERTITVDSSNGFYFTILVLNTKTAYISQPMLVFGSSIGEGNYVQPPGEIVWLEKNISLTNYTGASLGAADDATIILEAESNGKIPKGVTAIGTLLTATCASDDKTLSLGLDSNNPTLKLFTTASRYGSTSGLIPTKDDSIYLSLNDTFSAINISVYAVQVAP